MKILIGGAIAAVLGILGISVWFGEFLGLLKGALPIMLMLGGALAIYIGFDELKDSWKNKAVEEVPPPAEDKEEKNPEKYKQEIDELKKELETLKQAEPPKEQPKEKAKEQPKEKSEKK